VPHIIIEYADQLADDAEVVAILQAVHHAIADSGLFKANQIKTRACPFRQFTNAGGNDPYIHIQSMFRVNALVICIYGFIAFCFYIEAVAGTCLTVISELVY
jgi:hypothetical protein